MKNLFFLLFSLCFKISLAQDIEARLIKIKNNYTPEKIYIHYDKLAYIAGQTIWFKAYLEEGIFPSIKSTAISVELLNDSGKIIQKKILPILSAIAAGSIDIPENLPQGNYTIRAYTRTLMNFGTIAFYYHSFKIYNPSTLSNKVLVQKELKIYFLPEGGNLVGNIQNTVAFKCIDQWGIPAKAIGKIVDVKGNTIVSFSSTHNGMGVFTFTPNAGEQYTAICTLDTIVKSIPLPIASQHGTTLQVTRNQGAAIFEINATTVIDTALLPSYILGIEENTVVFKIPFSSNQKTLRGKIPEKDLPTGILQLTVFNNQNQPLAERLIFINSADYSINAIFKTDILDLNPRKKNIFSLSIPDTLTGSYSVSVTDAYDVLNDEPKAAADNILSRFLLTAELKGVVYEPTYYFEANDETHTNNLDLVMLTNGWRKYSWNELFNNSHPAMAFKDMNYISVKGTAYDADFNRPLKNAELSTFIKSKDGFSDFMSVSTDSVGVFQVPFEIFEDTAKFSFQNNSGKKSKINFNINSGSLSNLFSVVTIIPAPAYFMLPDAVTKNKIQNLYFKYVGKSSKEILLDEVKVNAKIKSEKEKYEKKYVTGAIGRNANSTLDFLKTPPIGSSTNILEYLKFKLVGVNITGGPLDYALQYRQNRSISGSSSMALFVDEMQQEPSYASSIQLADVAMVKVFPAGPLVGSGGALAIYTKKGDGGSPKSLFTNLRTVLVEGFSPSKEFFSPDYSPGIATDILNDGRTTLYWNPYLIFDKINRKINFSFFNNDNTKKIKIIIEGMQEDGKFLHLEKIVE